MAVDFAPGSPLRMSRPRRVFDHDARSIVFACDVIRCYDVAADGQRFYTVQNPAIPPSPVVTHVNLIQNWFEELNAKVPAGGAKEADGTACGRHGLPGHRAGTPVREGQTRVSPLPPCFHDSADSRKGANLAGILESAVGLEPTTC
jgi:hypothetical protein